MAINLIKVVDPGTTPPNQTVLVFKASDFIHASTFVQGTINVINILVAGGLEPVVLTSTMSSMANASTAMNNIYTDMEAYYNQS